MSQYYNTYFITATSAPVESYFSDLKRELTKALTPDRFVASHIKSIEGFMKICRSNQIQNMNTITPPSIGSPKQKVEKNDDCKLNTNVLTCIDDVVSDSYTYGSSSALSESDDNAQYENWKNLADKPFHDDTKKTKTKRWIKYKESCQDIKRLLNKSGLRSTTQPLIINGNLCKPVKINKNKVIIYNTCPFDALLACVVVGYIEFNQYRECVNEVAKSYSFFNVCKEVANYRATDSIYEERGKILWEIFQQKNVIVDNIQSLHTECNVTYLSEKLLKIMPSVSEKHVCDSCNVTKSFNNVLVILEI